MLPIYGAYIFSRRCGNRECHDRVKPNNMHTLDGIAQYQVDRERMEFCKNPNVQKKTKAIRTIVM